MSIKRVVNTNFWNDNKVVDLFSPEDRYFMLYLLTNPHTTQLGIYQFNKRIMAFELGYSYESIKVLLDRFETKYKIIKVSQETSEIAILNFLKHSIIKGGAPVRDCLIKEMKLVKNKNLITWVFLHLKNIDGLNDTVKKLIEEYEEKNGKLDYGKEKEKRSKKEKEIYNDNDNDNDNDNEVSYHDTYNDSLDDSLAHSHNKETKHKYDEMFEKVWKQLKSTPNDRKKLVTKKRKKELFEMGIDRVEKAIELYLKFHDMRFPFKRDNFFNEIIDNYIDKTEEDFKSINNQKAKNQPQQSNNIFLDIAKDEGII